MLRLRHHFRESIAAHYEKLEMALTLTASANGPLTKYILYKGAIDERYNKSLSSAIRHRFYKSKSALSLAQS